MGKADFTIPGIGIGRDNAFAVSGLEALANQPRTFSGRMVLDDNAPKVAKGMTVEVAGRKYKIAWARDWSGFRNGRRIRPRTAYFRATELRDRDE